MAYIEVEETMVVSDLSESFSSDDDGEGLLPAPVRGVRNCGIPPFLSKLYNIVSDKDSDSTISWVSIPKVAQNEKQVPAGGATSFAIWNQADFINKVLPLMSRSNNFDSFVTQLNNYGFKKLSWDRREYANAYFQEGKPHLLKNIKSRSSKRKIPQTEKLTREIKKLESESREVDHELNMFKEYVDNTMSKQKKIIQAMAKVIKSTFDHHRDVRMVHEMNVLGESSYAPSCVIQAEDEPLEKASEDQLN